MARLRWLYRLASVAAWASRRCLSLHGWANKRAVPVRPAPRVSVVPLDLDSLPRGTFVHLPLPDSASYAVAARAREALYLLGRQGEGRA